MTNSDKWVLKIGYAGTQPEETIPAEGVSYEECLRRFYIYVTFGAIPHPNYNQIVTMDCLDYDDPTEQVVYDVTYWQFYWDLTDTFPIICSFHFPTPPCDVFSVHFEWTEQQLIDVYNAFCVHQPITIDT